MEWNKEPRNKTSLIRSNDFQQGCQDHSMGKRIVCSVNCTGETGHRHAKE